MKFNKVLENIKTYEAGKPIELVVREFGIAPENVVKLASNENPIGTNPAVSKVIRSNADIAHLYPDDSMFELKASLSAMFNVENENIICESIADHHKVDAIFSDQVPCDIEKKKLLAILKLSETICKTNQIFGNEAVDYEFERIKEDLFCYLGISEYDFDELVEDVHDKGLMN